MFGGGGGLDPSKMQQMMKQMGIDIDELDAEEVIIRTSEEELVFTDADVQRMDAQGQQTYNIVGDPERRAAGETSDSAEEAEENEGIPQDDIELVAQRTGTSEDAAREALEATDGDLAAAVSRLE
jgi:nascent polypeptide-associated complex subunit alpha